MPSRLSEIERWLGGLAGANPRARVALEIETIAGGASPRRFHRVRDAAKSPEGDSREDSEGTRGLFRGRETAILMEVPPDTPDVAFARGLGRPWPFLEVRGLLESVGVRVPRLLAEACDEGLLLVEDLGETLAEHLVSRPSERESLYAMAVRDLAVAQERLSPLPEGSIVRLRAFDEKLLAFEIDHFREWALDARGRPLDATGQRTFDRARDWLVAAIVALPRGFVHRDYQSRNLLVTHGYDGVSRALGWIDFQDALLGPSAYDLVALLCDSYQPFDPRFVERRLDDYRAARGLSNDELLSIRRQFDLITVQRKLKDAGRFVFIEKQRKDSSFLPFVEPTLGIVRQALARVSDVPELAALARLLDDLDL